MSSLRDLATTIFCFAKSQSQNQALAPATKKTEGVASVIFAGRQEATELELLEPLANSILEHWDFTILKEEFGDLDKLFMPDYNVAYAY